MTHAKDLCHDCMTKVPAMDFDEAVKALRTIIAINDAFEDIPNIAAEIYLAAKHAHAAIGSTMRGEEAGK